MEKDDYIFEEVEEMPKFNNGDINTFVKWVYSNLQYPKYAQDNGISGIVIFSFIVESDGTLSNVEILRSPDESLSNEVLRVLKLSPKWTSGVRNGRAVRVKQQASVRFVVQ
jgi:TonB family protein